MISISINKKENVQMGQPPNLRSRQTRLIDPSDKDEKKTHLTVGLTLLKNVLSRTHAYEPRLQISPYDKKLMFLIKTCKTVRLHPFPQSQYHHSQTSTEATRLAPRCKGSLSLSLSLSDLAIPERSNLRSHVPPSHNPSGSSPSRRQVSMLLYRSSCSSYCRFQLRRSVEESGSQHRAT